MVHLRLPRFAVQGNVGRKTFTIKSLQTTPRSRLLCEHRVVLSCRLLVMYRGWYPTHAHSNFRRPHLVPSSLSRSTHVRPAQGWKWQCSSSYRWSSRGRRPGTLATVKRGRPQSARQETTHPSPCRSQVRSLTAEVLTTPQLQNTLTHYIISKYKIARSLTRGK